MKVKAGTVIIELSQEEASWLERFLRTNWLSHFSNEKEPEEEKEIREELCSLLCKLREFKK
jgi:hypothetical protein